MKDEDIKWALDEAMRRFTILTVIEDCVELGWVWDRTRLEAWFSEALPAMVDMFNKNRTPADMRGFAMEYVYSRCAAEQPKQPATEAPCARKRLWAEEPEALTRARLEAQGDLLFDVLRSEPIFDAQIYLSHALLANSFASIAGRLQIAISSVRSKYKSVLASIQSDSRCRHLCEDGADEADG